MYSRYLSEQLLTNRLFLVVRIQTSHQQRQLFGRLVEFQRRGVVMRMIMSLTLLDSSICRRQMAFRQKGGENAPKEWRHPRGDSTQTAKERQRSVSNETTGAGTALMRQSIASIHGCLFKATICIRTSMTTLHAVGVSLFVADAYT